MFWNKNIVPENIKKEEQLIVAHLDAHALNEISENLNW